MLHRMLGEESPWRIQQEADGRWSVYEGMAFRNGPYRNRDTAQARLDEHIEAEIERLAWKAA